MLLKPDFLWQALQPRLEEYFRRTGDTQLVGVFVGASSDTVMRWVSNEQSPGGERLIKLWHYLSAVGMKSFELEDLDAFNRYVGELYAFEVLTMDEVCYALH